MLKVAIAGAWHVHFDQYSKEVMEREDCKITALWDDDKVRGKTSAEKLNCEFVSDYDRLLERDDVDGIVITSATNQHPEIMIKAANKGKHIFTEKVLCFTKEQAKKIKEAVVKNNIKFCISFPWRCKSEYMLVKKIIEEGMLGKVTYARVRNAHSGATSGWLPEHFFDEKACGGGAMMDLGAHPMYLMLDLFGMPEAVTSVFTKVTGRQVEDNAVSVLTYKGMIAVSETAFVSQSCPFSMEISGTNATLYWGFYPGKIVINTKEGLITPELSVPKPSPLNQWVDGILYGKEIEFGIDDAMALTVLMEKAYESDRQKKRVEINDFF